MDRSWLAHNGADTMRFDDTPNEKRDSGDGYDDSFQGEKMSTGRPTFQQKMT